MRLDLNWQILVLALAAARIPSTFVGGLRVTSAAAMPVVADALLHVNRRLVASLKARGRNAIGVDARDISLFRCKRALGPAGEDLEQVGRIVSVSVERIDGWWRSGMLPVIAPIGTFDDGLPCNINADDVAGALAGALRVPAIFVTDVPGVILDAQVRSAIALAEVEKAIDEGRIHDGMIPKALACAEAVRCGAPYAAIVQAGRDVLRGGGTRIYATSRTRARW